MAPDKRDVLEVLKFELEFLEHGGYGRYVRTPWKPTSIFQDSPSCLNFNSAERKHPCNECLLMDFVPARAQGEEVPCHHIPLRATGETVSDLAGKQILTEEALRQWLREQIARLEQEQTSKSAQAADGRG